MVVVELMVVVMVVAVAVVVVDVSMQSANVLSWYRSMAVFK